MKRHLLLIALLWLGSTPALAQRSLAFDGPELPAGGSLAIPAAQGLPAQGAFERIDAATAGALRRAATAAGFTGASGTRLDLPGFGGYERLLVVGSGAGPADAAVLRDFGGTVAQQFARSPAPRVELLWDGNEPGAALQIAYGAQLGQYRFDKYRTAAGAAPSAGGELVVRSAAGRGAAGDYAAHWQPTADAVAFARDLVTEPANVLYPESFVARVRERARGLPLAIEVLDVPAMQRLGMGSMLAVGQGSQRPPRLLVLRYNGGRAGEAPVAFVGKGITFDSGGISIKPGANMWRMKYDMTGAAVASATLLNLAARRAPVNAIAVAALAENMPSGSASRPGDVVTTASGKTYEIMSTDAEGRMVLADALWYVQRETRPRAIIDIATLTGSIVTALGDDYAGLFSRDDALAGQLVGAGERSGERVWRMPLRDDYAARMASPIADMRNGGASGPGSGTAAWFLGEFVARGTPWAHLDIAGMAWVESGGKPTVPAGATAFGVRLLDQWVRDTFEQRLAQ